MMTELLDNAVPQQTPGATVAQNLPTSFQSFDNIVDPLDVAYSLAPLAENNEGERAIESRLTAIVRAVSTDLLDDVEPDTRSYACNNYPKSVPYHSTGPSPHRTGPW